MGLFDGKKGLILGVANDHSIAWAIAEFVMGEGAVCGFTHLPDRARRRTAAQSPPRGAADRRRAERQIPGAHGSQQRRRISAP